MYPVDPATLAHVIIADQLRDAERRRLARQFRGQQSAAAPADRPLPRHPRLWALVHLRHAYS